MAIKRLVMSEMLIPKTIQEISLSFSKFLSVMSWVVLGVFVYSNADFMCFNFPM